MDNLIAKKWHFKDKLVLLVEDNDLVHDLVRTIMERVGVDIDICMNGAEALEAVQNKNYDAVLMDIQMPVMDGLQATHEIRQLGGAMLELPIIAMSANFTSEDIEMGRKVGMTTHLGKPVDKELLYATLSRYLGNNIIKGTGYSTNIPIDFPQLKHIDTNDGLARVAGNAKVYRVMLSNFRQKYLHAASELTEYFQQQDFERAVGLSHNIKGNAGNLGARELHRYAAEIEQASKERDLDLAISLLPALQFEISAVIHNIETLATVVDPKQGSIGSYNAEIYAAKVSSLTTLLDTDFGEAMNLLEELQQVAGNMYKEEMKLLEKHMAGFDVDAAHSILEMIQKNINES